MARPNTWNTMPNNIRITRPNIIRNSRSTKQIMARSVKTRSISVECKCPPSVVTYIRWGNDTCPYTIYTTLDLQLDLIILINRDRPIMLIILPIMLCCSAHKIYQLFIKYCTEREEPV